MSRIRTIKPQFFTSEDIVALSPLARLLYIGIWCEADREGRLVWRPRTLKLRYLPDDACDAEALCGELVGRGLVVPYGDGLAFIPKFAEHQHVNPRESASKLPPPEQDANADASRRVGTRANLDVHAQGGREGKESREGKEEECSASSASDEAASILPFKSADPPAAPIARAPDAELYDRGKQILGPSGGGLITKLLKAKGGSIALARAALETATTKQDPREYLGGVIRGREEEERERRRGYSF